MLTKRLRERRKAMGMTQAEIAEAIGVSPKTVSHWETGERLPDFPTILRLAQVLATSVAYLGGETSDPRSMNEIGQGSGESIAPYFPTRLAPEDIQELERVYLEIERRRKQNL